MPTNLHDWAKRKADHAGLQPVEVEVKGKNGTHTATRWKKMKEMAKRIAKKIVKSMDDAYAPGPVRQMPEKIYVKGVPVHIGRRAQRDVKGWATRKVQATRRKAGKSMSAAEVVATIQKEAKAAGATLANNGKGGLDPNLALTVFRRDKFSCRVPNCKTAKKDVDLDHIGGHAHELEEDPKAAAWLKEQAGKGKENTPDGLHCLCLRHHDLVHKRDRAIENGKQPPPMTK